MPFEVKFDNADEVLAKFADVQNRITGLYEDVPNTFMDWQREDMNRRYPKVEGAGGNTTTYSTTIYPRARVRVRKARKSGGSGQITRQRANVAARRPGSRRPILRPELFEQLRKRMIAICEAALKWP